MYLQWDPHSADAPPHWDSVVELLLLIRPRVIVVMYAAFLYFCLLANTFMLGCSLL